MIYLFIFCIDGELFYIRHKGTDKQLKVKVVRGAAEAVLQKQTAFSKNSMPVRQVGIVARRRQLMPFLADIIGLGCQLISKTG